MGRQEKGTNGFIVLAKYHTEKKIMRFNICNKFSNGVILRNKKNNLCTRKREKMEKRGTRICFVLELKTEWVGGIEKELNLNETKVGMGLNLKDERS